MTAKPGTSHHVHSGFVDLATLIASTPSRLISQSRLWSNPEPYDPTPKRTEQWEYAGVPHTSEGFKEDVIPRGRGGKAVRDGAAGRGGKVGAMARGGRVGVKSAELRPRKVDKRLIGPPTDFRHIFHASTFEEATKLLLRWSLEGVDDKIGDPSWADPIKDLVKVRAREQQAKAVAAVVEATTRSRAGGTGYPPLHPPGQLHVVNGLPSSIYSTATTSLNPVTLLITHGNDPSAHASYISPMLVGASTPNLIANLPSGFFNPSEREALPAVASPPVSPPVGPFATPFAVSPAQLHGHNSNVIHAQSTLASFDKSLISPKKTAPLTIKKKSVPTLATVSPIELAEINRETSIVDRPAGRPALLPRRSSRLPPTPSSNPTTSDLPFRVIKPSLETLEKTMSIALFFEQYYHALLRAPPIHAQSTPHAGNYLLNRARRLAQLEATFALPENRFMSEAEKESMREELNKEENAMLREKRRKVDAKAFEMGRVIGHGAFGVVRIAREREGGRLVAIKQLRKSDMLRKSQEGHVKAEKDLLAAAASQSLPSADGSSSSRIVQLFYAFQDLDHLYLVLEYMGGGDLLNLLVERDTLPEPMTRFYIAEMILSLQETHALGYAHRDIKPDNFLFDPNGHLKVSDFGLATDLHWAHDTNYYEAQRQALLRKHGVDLEMGGNAGGKTRRMKKEEVERIMGREWVGEGKGMLTWRDKNRKRLAYSVCGTNSYMAPEVIRGQGYGFSCDWWSLGVIMYESLYGYPPFVSSSRHVTRQKILNWKTTLKFPPKPRLSAQCLDLMTRLLCEPEDRLGSNPAQVSVLTTRTSGTAGKSGLVGFGKDGADEIMRHPWFEGMDWENLHKAEAPYQPDLQGDDDTRHFDVDIPNEPLAPAGGAVDTTKDPLLRHPSHGPNILAIRKQLAFKGWTFKAPIRVEKRYGHMSYVSSGSGRSDDTASFASEETVMGHGQETGALVLGGLGGGNRKGTVRARALSL